MTKKLYRITVEVLGEKTTKTGSTPLSALKKFNMGWEEIKGKGYLSVKYGDKVWGRNMNSPTLRRIFNNDITRETWAKNIKLLLK